MLVSKRKTKFDSLEIIGKEVVLAYFYVLNILSRASVTKDVGLDW
jgi:hypothetical protein